MLVNVIQRKENEEQIIIAQKKKEELLERLFYKNEDLNEYAHVVSHDLKAPLISIHSLVSWFIEDNKGSVDAAVMKPLSQVLLNVEKMDHLIKGILNYAMIDNLEVNDSLVDLNILIEDLLPTLLIPAHININIQKNLPVLKGNDWRFKQIFQNLLQNSIQYNNKDIGYISIGFTEDQNQNEFFVNDNGVGIKSDYFDRIFKVFTKLDYSGISSGIGLSIVKKIITHYKGQIRVESELGNGSTFYFSIPKH